MSVYILCLLTCEFSGTNSYGGGSGVCEAEACDSGPEFPAATAEVDPMVGPVGSGWAGGTGGAERGAVEGPATDSGS